jgi:hypothetical protein
MLRLSTRLQPAIPDRRSARFFFRHPHETGRERPPLPITLLVLSSIAIIYIFLRLTLQTISAADNTSPAAGLTKSAAAAVATDTGKRPRLVVIISVDQLCYEYLERFRANFTSDGFFQRCSTEGTWFTECHHRHAYTVTAPGHAVLMTGNYPGPLGIIDNTWYDRRLGKEVYCVEDLNYPIVGTPTTQAELKGVSPLKLHAETVGDVLKRATNGQAKVFGVTLKDRAAVLMSGKQADSAYWFDPNSGNWVTSRYYRAALPDYLVQLNEGDTAKCYAGSRWQLLYPAEKYSPRHADDAPFEGNYEKLGRAFPHEFVTETNTQYYKQILCSPFGNEMTLRVAELLIEREHLGQDEIPDILNLGFSANDYVGHNFGPHSLEVEDITYRTDLLLGRLLRVLDEKVGIGQWTCVLSADHAVTPIPEYAQTLGLPARRSPLGDLTKLRAKIEQALVDKFGPPPLGKTYVERLSSRELFLSTSLIESMELTRIEQYRSTARDLLAQEAGVALAFTREDLIDTERTADDIPAARIAPHLQHLFASGSEPLTLFRRSYNARLSGDVVFCLPPYCIQGSTPATHGLPYRTDSHVPLLWIGAGIRQQQRNNTPVGPAQIAATLSQLLQIPPPAQHVAPPLADLLTP